MNTRTVFILGALVFPLLPGVSNEARAADRRSAEVRALWITRWDFQTEDDVRRAIRWSAAIGLNRIFFQVRGRADAFYRSTLEPWGEELGGEDPGFDPLAVAIDEARQLGVELDAWINVLPGWKGSREPTSPQHLANQHRDWFLVDRAGKRHVLDPADYTIVNPCYPEVRQHLTQVVKEIVTRYPVNGLQLDYIRFIGRDPARGLDYPYDQRTLELFRKFAGASPFDAPEEWNRWRGLAVDTLVYRISEAARKARPGLRVSVAAIQDYSRAKNDLFQDVVKWQQNGWIDEVYPMTYQNDLKDFRRVALQTVHASGGGKVIPGVGLHLLESPEEAVRQILTARSVGGAGYCLFAFASLFPSPSHESKSDAASKALRSQLRARIRDLNGIPPVEREGRGAVSANVPRS